MCFVIHLVACVWDGDVGLQLLMPREVFCSSGGRFSGIYLLQGQMKSTQRLLHRILRLVGYKFSLVSHYATFYHAKFK